MTQPLYLPDKEIAALVGIPYREWQSVAVVLERHGLPKRDPLFENKRCWPVVEAFLIERARPAAPKTAGEHNGYRGFKTSARRAAASPTAEDLAVIKSPSKRGAPPVRPIDSGDPGKAP